MPPAAPSANAVLQDLLLHHEVGLRRLGNTQLRQSLVTLSQVEKRLEAEIRERFGWIASRGFDASDFTLQRLDKNLLKTRAMIREGAKVLGADVRSGAMEAAKYERTWASAALKTVVGSHTAGVLGVAAQTGTNLAAIFSKEAMGGRQLREWVEDFGNGAYRRFRDGMRAEMLAGHGIDETVRNLFGKAVRTPDGLIRVGGVFQASRTEAETFVRTAYQHTLNAARREVFAQNDDLLKGWEWVATLDDRTCELCGRRDGLTYTLEDEPIDHGIDVAGGPGSIHPRCRCSRAPVLKDWEELGLSGAPELDPIMRQSLDGLVPATTTFSDWAMRGGVERLRDLFGPRRAAMMRDGLLKVPELWDDKGRLLSLKELGLRDTSALDAARKATEELRRTAEALRAAELRAAQLRQEQIEAGKRAAEAKRLAAEAKRLAEEKAKAEALAKAKALEEQRRLAALEAEKAKAAAAKAAAEREAARSAAEAAAKPPEAVLPKAVIAQRAEAAATAVRQEVSKLSVTKWKGYEDQVASLQFRMRGAGSWQKMDELERELVALRETLRLQALDDLAAAMKRAVPEAGPAPRYHANFRTTSETRMPGKTTFTRKLAPQVEAAYEASVDRVNAFFDAMFRNETYGALGKKMRRVRVDLRPQVRANFRDKGAGAAHAVRMDLSQLEHRVLNAANQAKVNASRLQFEQTFVHEMAHRFEFDSLPVRRATHDFLTKRLVKGETAKQLGGSYDVIETYFADKFGERYVGKVYLKKPVLHAKVNRMGFNPAPGSTLPRLSEYECSEILSMGFELMYKDPMKFLKDDPDFFNLVLNVMTGNV